MAEPDFLNDERRVWLFLALLGAATLIGLKAAGFGLIWTSLAGPIAGGAGLALLARFYRAMRPEPRLAATCAALAQMIGFTLIAAPLSYLAAGLDRPLVDDMLVRADAAIGFDWRAYLAWADAHPAIAAVLRTSYESLLPQLAAAVCLLGFTARFAELRRFARAIIIAGLATILVSAWLPALGGYAWFGLGPIAYPHLSPADAWQHVPDMLHVRDGSLRLLSVPGLQGLIAFPSFHAALALIFAWAFWQHRLTRWPGLALEAMVLLSTPVDGAHYLSDVLAGLAVAAAALALARPAAAPRRIRAADPAPLPA